MGLMNDHYSDLTQRIYGRLLNVKLRGNMNNPTLSENIAG